LFLIHLSVSWFSKNHIPNKYKQPTLKNVNFCKLILGILKFADSETRIIATSFNFFTLFSAKLQKKLKLTIVRKIKANIFRTFAK